MTRTAISAIALLMGVASPALAQSGDANYTPDIESHTPTDSLLVKLTNEESGGVYTIGEFFWHSGWVVNPHLHEHSTETFYVMDGRLDLRVGDQDVTLLPGAVYNIPPGVPHSAVGVISGMALGIFAPGGYEEFMAAEQQLTDEQKDDDEFMAAFRAEHDIDIKFVDDLGLPYDYEPPAEAE